MKYNNKKIFYKSISTIYHNLVYKENLNLDYEKIVEKYYQNNFNKHNFNFRFILKRLVNIDDLLDLRNENFLLYNLSLYLNNF